MLLKTVFLLLLSAVALCDCAALSSIEGTWKLESRTNFGSFLRALKVNPILIVAVSTTKPEVTFTDVGDGNVSMFQVNKLLLLLFPRDLGDGDVSMFQNYYLVSSTSIFRMGEPFMERTADGRTVRSTMRLTSPSTMEHLMEGIDGAADSFCVWNFGAVVLNVRCSTGSVVASAKYNRVA